MHFMTNYHSITFVFLCLTQNEISSLMNLKIPQTQRPLEKKTNNSPCVYTFCSDLALTFERPTQFRSSK